ncbi:MAG: hypothetical protein K0S53_2617 [Bacteroidetes bacterium]|jgi:hypothetical protein|nr:hypothetical protein [Bacteroidota bacterium]
MKIVNEILNWPVLIQGILGSFLFWVIFTIGQKSFTLLNNKIKSDNKTGSHFGKFARDTFYQKQYEFSTYSFFICIYGAIHYFLKFVLAVFLSYIVSTLIPVFAYVGYILALYFIFRAMTYVTHFSSFKDEDPSNPKN